MGKGQYAHLSYDVGTINKGESLFLRAASEAENKSALNAKATPQSAKRSRRASISEGFPLPDSTCVEALPAGWRSGRRASMPIMQRTGDRPTEGHAPAPLMTLVSATATPAPEQSLFGTPSHASSAASVSGVQTVAHRPSRVSSRVSSQPPSCDTSQPPSRGHSRRPSGDGAMLSVALARDARPYSPMETEPFAVLPKASRPASAQVSKGAVVLSSSSARRPASAGALRASAARAFQRESPQAELMTPASRLEAILQQHAGQPDALGEGPGLTPQHVVKLSVEHCVAPRPSKTLRGSQEKYTRTFQSLRAAVEPFVGAAVLVMSANEDAALSPRIGAFEVSFTLLDGASGALHGPFPLFSKLERGAWPSPRRLASQLDVAVRALLKHAQH